MVGGWCQVNAGLSCGGAEGPAAEGARLGATPPAVIRGQWCLSGVVKRIEPGEDPVDDLSRGFGDVEDFPGFIFRQLLQRVEL